MSQLSVELEFLKKLRDDLAKNINAMGVTANNTETLKELIPKVLFISQGNPHTSYFNAEFTGTPIEGNKHQIKNGKYGVFLYGEPISFDNVIDVFGYFKMSSCKLTFTGTGLNTLNLTAPGWTINKAPDGTSITFTMNTLDINSGGLISSKLDAIYFDSISEVHATCTFEATEKESGTVQKVAGSTSFNIQQNSWQHVEDTYQTMGILSAYTWEEMENLVFDNRAPVTI